MDTTTIIIAVVVVVVAAIAFILYKRSEKENNSVSPMDHAGNHTPAPPELEKPPANPPVPSKPKNPQDNYPDDWPPTDRHGHKPGHKKYDPRCNSEEDFSPKGPFGAYYGQGPFPPSVPWVDERHRVHEV